MAGGFPKAVYLLMLCKHLLATTSSCYHLVCLFGSDTNNSNSYQGIHTFDIAVSKLALD